MPVLSWSQVNAWRMAQHYLTLQADSSRLLEVVSRVGALQAQVMSAAELQLWARISNLSPTDVGDALWKQRSLVKTWVLRGTLHLVAARDFPLYVGAISEALIKFYTRGSWLKYNGVTMEEFEAIISAVDATLTDTFITRKQLAEAIGKHTGSPHIQTRLESGWGVLLKPSAVRGLIVFGESDGQNVTFVHSRHWLGDWSPVTAPEAVREVALRYLTAYGPATADDFGHWVGMQPADAKKAFKLLGSEIEPVEVEGWKAWALVSSLTALDSARPIGAVRLLPNFDPYVISASHHAQFMLDEAYKARVYRPQGWISPVILVDGRIEGVWGYERKRSQIVVTVDLFSPQDEVVKRIIQMETQRLGAFFGSDAELIFAKDG